MQTRILAAVLCGCALASAAVAETIVVDDQVQVRDSQLQRPKRGLTMDQVEKQFGAPSTRHAAVGGSSQQQPQPRPWRRGRRTRGRAGGPWGLIDQTATPLWRLGRQLRGCSSHAQTATFCFESM